jgi:superfamily I DNA and/or RNA helicase
VTSRLLYELRIPPIVFFDSGVFRPEIAEQAMGTSFVNEFECLKIVGWLERTLPNLQNTLSIAVITPYKAQVRRILSYCERSNCIARAMSTRNDDHNRIEVNSVDGFQGREKDIVIFSCVRCNSNSNRVGINRNRGLALAAIGFVAEKRRLNVAVTRAKKALLIFGHCDTLREDLMWREMIESFSQRGAVQQVL